MRSIATYHCVESKLHCFKCGCVAQVYKIPTRMLTLSGRPIRFIRQYLLEVQCSKKTVYLD